MDLTRDAPVSGDYAGVSPMGLIWSQSPWTRPAASPSTIPSPSRWSPRSWRAPPAQVQGKFTQRLAAEGVTRQDVREHGLVGTLYLPPGAAPGSHPAVLILNGSGGGINEPRAALYALAGYAAFALAYFKAPGLSDYISNTPLEYFQSGLRWLRDKVRPKHDFVAVSGQSRGGELVLLLGATFPRKCRPWSPTCPAPWSIAARTPATPRSAAKARPGCWAASPCPTSGKTTAPPPGLRSTKAPRRTATRRPSSPPCKTPTPWPAPASRSRTSRPGHAAVRHRRRLLAVQPVLEDGADKLTEVDHPYPVRWLDYENGGHSILFPHVPTTQLVYAHPVSGKISTSGGNPKDNARADQESWEGVLTFLDAAVKARASGGHARPSAQRNDADVTAQPGRAG